LISIINLYNLPEKFFYLPNQFWKHKNHETVFKAIKVLKDRGVKVTLVCTGYPGDYRHPKYVSELFQKLSEWNIRDQVIYLGMIPHDHLLLLMRQSITVINPSLFEGWGISVDEARSLGKQVLVSDIAAHREQDPPKAMFFNPTNCEELCEKLKSLWLNTTPGPDFALEAEARETLPKRFRSYGESFVSVAQSSLAG